MMIRDSGSLFWGHHVYMYIVHGLRQCCRMYAQHRIINSEETQQI